MSRLRQHKFYKPQEPPTYLAQPLYLSKVSCGFPSPADDYMESKLDLNTTLVSHPAATFFLRAQGESMQAAGIFDGDLLVVDRSLAPRAGSIVVAVLEGELVVKRLRMQGKRAYLVAEHPNYPPIPLHSEQATHFWGVVTYVVHAL